MFLSYAAIYAKTHGITDLVTGVCETDFSGYPDCRDIFVKSLNVTINLAMDYNFVIHTPLMWLNKAETWKMADDLGVLDTIYNETLTCYNGVRSGQKHIIFTFMIIMRHSVRTQQIIILRLCHIVCLLACESLY